MHLLVVLALAARAQDVPPAAAAPIVQAAPAAPVAPPAPAGLPATLSVADLAERTKPSVVLLTITDDAGNKLSTGTGFFVSGDGRVVTNAHVVDGGELATATLADGRTIGIEGLLAFDKARDIAILQADAAGPPLALGASASARVGEEVVVIGSPLGLSAVVSEGIVSAIREEGIAAESEVEDRERREQLKSWRIQVTAAVSPGSSGSPIMTRSGEVIAVAVGIRSDGQSVNFGVPVEVVREMLAAIDPAAAPRPLEAADEPKKRGKMIRNIGFSLVFYGLLAWGYFAFFRKRA